MARKSKESDEPEEEADQDAEKDKKESKEDKKGKKSDEPEEDPSKRSQYIGLGLIASVIVGFSPLRDAFQGNGSFESAMFRFLACFVVCVFAASILGRMVDGAPEPEPEESEDGELGDGATEHGLSSDGIGAEIADGGAGLGSDVGGDTATTGIDGAGLAGATSSGQQGTGGGATDQTKATP